MKAFKRMQSSPHMLRGERETDNNSLFRDGAGDSATKRQKSLNRMATTDSDSLASSSSNKSLLDARDKQNASLIKKISLSGPEIRRMVAMKAAMAANLRSKKIEKCFIVTQVHRFSTTKRFLTVDFQDRTVTVHHDKKSSFEKRYNCHSYVGMVPEKGTSLTIQIQEGNVKKPKVYKFATQGERDLFVSVIRGLKSVGSPSRNVYKKIIDVIDDCDMEAVIEASVLRQILTTHLGLIPDKQSKNFSVVKIVNSMVEWAQHALFPDDVEELKFSYLTFLLLYFRLGCSSKSAEKFMSAWVQQADGEMHQSLQDLHRQRRQKRSSVQNLFAMGMVQMLPGEMVWTETLDVAWSLTTGGSKKTSIQGGLYATNYRLIFVCFPSQFDDEVSGANTKSQQHEFVRGRSYTATRPIVQRRDKSNASTSLLNISVDEVVDEEQVDISDDDTAQLTSSENKKLDGGAAILGDKAATDDAADMKKRQSLSALEKLEKTREEHKVNFHLTPDGKNMLAPLQLTSTTVGQLHISRVQEIPLLTIQRCEVQQQKKNTIKLVCKDMRVVHFVFDKKKDWISSFMEMLKNHVYVKSLENHDCFAVLHKEAIELMREAERVKKTNKRFTTRSKSKSNIFGGEIDGWELLDWQHEFYRQGVLKDQEISANSRWRMFDNSDFQMSPTYPPKFIIPAQLTDAELLRVTMYRSNARIPALIWVHPINGTTLSRCSQPRSGLFSSREASDEKLVNLLRYKGTLPTAGASIDEDNDGRLTVLDCRPLSAATGNKLKGKGYENVAHYGDNVSLEFCNIPNIHPMRKSHDALHGLVNPKSMEDDDTSFLSRLEQTEWLKWIGALIRSAIRIVDLMDQQKTSVMIHCSDGWDRTPQLSSLSQICMDPYYRTMRGMYFIL